MMPIVPHGYANFAAVIAVQLMWLTSVTLAQGAMSALPRRLALGAIAGLPLGIVFDVIIGNAASVFHYSGMELEGSFLLLNSVLSYGLAVATVLTVNARGLPRSTGRRPWFVLAGAGVATAIGFFLLLQGRSPMVTMFLVGTLVLIASEGAAHAMGRQGYVQQLASGRWRPIARIWVFSVATGAVYELANHFFPLWVWANKSPTLAGNMLLIVAFGYFVLFVPIFTAVNMIRSYIRTSSPTDSVT
jgi:hypothetical protein